MSAHEMFSMIGFTCIRDNDKVTYTKSDRTWIFNLSQGIVQFSSLPINFESVFEEKAVFAQLDEIYDKNFEIEKNMRFCCRYDEVKGLIVDNKKNPTTEIAILKYSSVIIDSVEDGNQNNLFGFVYIIFENHLVRLLKRDLLDCFFRLSNR